MYNSNALPSQDTPHNLLYEGRYAHKDAMLGSNKDEGTYWILYALPGMYRDQPSVQNYTMFQDGVDIIDWDLSMETRDAVKAMYSPANTGDLEANRWICMYNSYKHVSNC